MAIDPLNANFAINFLVQYRGNCIFIISSCVNIFNCFIVKLEGLLTIAGVKIIIRRLIQREMIYGPIIR